MRVRVMLWLQRSNCTTLVWRKCQIVDLCNNQKRKASHISVKVRVILEFHTFKYCCEQERQKGVSAPKRWLMNSFGLHLWVPFPLPVAWWTVGKSTPVGSLASWYLVLLSKLTVLKFCAHRFGSFIWSRAAAVFSTVWKREALCPLSPCVNLGPNVFYKQRAAL